jgi:hypothetical protein
MVQHVLGILPGSAPPCHVAASPSPASSHSLARRAYRLWHALLAALELGNVRPASRVSLLDLRDDLDAGAYLEKLCGAVSCSHSSLISISCRMYSLRGGQ